ncbi:hypothetical protein M5689_002249 [Euphorbia peplus]|nr:hypothetical protein M5689_002249 [Euphorbia peplus]
MINVGEAWDWSWLGIRSKNDTSSNTSPSTGNNNNNNNNKKDSSDCYNICHSKCKSYTDSVCDKQCKPLCKDKMSQGFAKIDNVLSDGEDGALRRMGPHSPAASPM